MRAQANHRLKQAVAIWLLALLLIIIGVFIPIHFTVLSSHHNRQFGTLLSFSIAVILIYASVHLVFPIAKRYTHEAFILKRGSIIDAKDLKGEFVTEEELLYLEEALFLSDMLKKTNH